MPTGVYERKKGINYNHKVQPLAERFWSHVNKTDGCWLWTGTKSDGYGKITIYIDGQRKCRFAHIVAYELVKGKVPDGYDLDHLCRNHSCVNPDHLDPVPHQINMERSHKSRYNSLKQFCPAGHPYDEENTYYNNGRRTCRTCVRERARKRCLSKTEVK